MTISLSDLKAKRAAMTQGEWRQGAHERDAIFAPYREGLGHERVVLRMNKNGEFAEPATRDAAGIVATHNAANVLIAAIEAAVNFALAQEPLAPGDFAQPEFDTLWAALAKVQR